MKPAPRRLPAKVEAAQNYLYYTLSVRRGGNEPSIAGDCPRAEHDLTRQEGAVADAALQVLLQYFRGEMDFGDFRPGRVDIDDDDPKQPAKIS